MCVVGISPYFSGFKRGVTESLFGRLCWIFAAFASSFLENMSIAVSAGDPVAESVGASLQLGCCVFGGEATVGAEKNWCFNSVLEI